MAEIVSDLMNVECGQDVTRVGQNVSRVGQNETKVSKMWKTVGKIK